MDTDLGQADIEHGPSREVRSPPDTAGVGGSTTLAGRVSSSQSMHVTDTIIEEKISQDDRYGSSRTPTFGRVMNDLNRSLRVGDTGHTATTQQTLYSDSDPTSKIWALYLSQAGKVDKEHSDSWTANTDGVLLFSGLFSAVLATFLGLSYPLLQPNLTDTTNQLLTQIYQQQQLSTNGTGSSQPLRLANTSSFRPPSFAVRVNTLWFISLATSTGCALLATLMQQSTRRYMQNTHGPYGPPKRARIRAFFAEGVEKFELAAMAEVLPVLLHASFLLFYLGLVDFLMNTNRIVGFFLLTAVVLGFLTYFILTIMPLIYPNSPYQTPLSSSCWFVLEMIPLLGLWIRRRNKTVQIAISERQSKIRKGMHRALESKATRLNAQADTNLLLWMLKSLDEDQELEEFLDGLSGLFHGPLGHHSLRLREGLEQPVKPVAEKLFATCTTGLLPEGLRRQRLAACLRAIWCFSSTIDSHFRAIWDQWDTLTNDPWGPLSTETWAVASNMITNLDPFIALRAHSIQALMAVMWSKGRWQCDQSEATSLLQHQLGASSVDIDRWRHTNGDQLQLALAANLLAKSLPLLRELDKLQTGRDTMHKNELKAILDTICVELDASEVPHELQARFADGAEVVKVFNIRDAAFDLKGPWRKIFTPVDIY